jgi:methyl-accepting chemotaxis protein
VYPAKDTTMTHNNLMDVRLTASDDYGLRNLKIFYQINQNAIQDTLLFRQSALNFVNISHILDFRNSALFPGDEVTYWAEVFDNSPLNQKATTPRFKLTIPSIEDIFKRLEEEDNQRNQILNAVLDDVREMQREFDMKRREMLRKEQMNWDDQKAIEKFIEDQQMMNEMVENVANNYDQMIQQMENSETISKEILEKMQRIQEIMDQISTDELRKAMENLQKSMETMNQDDIRKAMQDFQFNMQDFAEKLEQTLKLLEEIKNEQNVEKQLEIAKEMYRMQDDLNKRTEESMDPSNLVNEQQRIQDKLDALKEQMQKTLDDMQNSGSPMQAQMQEMIDEMNESGLSEDLQEALENMQNNQKQKASEKQQSSLSKMSRMISKMEEMKSDIAGSGMQGMVEAIEMAIYRLLMISREHNEKVSRIGNDPIPFMPAFINDYESVGLAMNTLYMTPQVLLFLGQKFFFDLNNMMKAYRELFMDVQNSRFHTHKKHTADIQSGINLTIFNLMQALNNMDSEGGGGGSSGGMESLMQTLQQMSGQQMAMNMMTQSIMEQMSSQGNRMSQQMRESLQEMANEEQRMAENLQRMLHTNPEAQKHANTLNEIAKDMNEVAQRLRQNRVDRNLFDQQNRIMSRLIEVQRSINKRDRSNQRKGETAEDRLWELPTDLNLNINSLSDRKLLEDEIQKLPLEYRQIILEYLRRLNE